MKNIYVYMPFFVQKKERDFDYLEKTLRSFEKYKEIKSVKVFFCQNYINEELKSFTKKFSLNIENIYVNEKYGKYLPINVYNYMLNDLEVSDKEILYYTESDQILHIKNKDVIDIINGYLEQGYIIMPHRLGKTKCLNYSRYKKFNGLYVGNFFECCIDDFDNIFFRMKEYKETYKYHTAYAGCFFIKKPTLKEVGKISKYYGFEKKIMSLVAYLHARRIIGKIFKWGFPYGMELEAPSLILSFKGKTILKFKDIGNLRVEHLSANGYV